MATKYGFVLRHIDPEDRNQGPIYLQSTNNALTDKIYEALFASTEQEAEGFKKCLKFPDTWKVVPATIY